MNKKKILNLRNVATIVACLAVTMIFASCEKPENPDDPNNPPVVGELIELTSPITENTTLKDLGLPIDYFYAGTSLLEVKNNATLTIEPGVTIQFTKTGGGMDIKDGACIKALGTANKHIQLVGATTDKGSWRGIKIASVTANVLDYVEILNAGSENYDRSAALYIDNGKVSVTNSTIDRSSRNGITLEGRSGNQAAELTVFSNNTVSNCDKAPIYTYSYCASYSLRNLANDNAFTGNTNAYIHISQDMNTNIHADMTLHHLNGYPWYFEGGLTIDADRDVTIEPGAVILVGTNVYIRVPASGHLIADGTANARITIKGLKNNAGYWDGIEVFSQTPGTKLNYCDISGAGHGYYGGNLYLQNGVSTAVYVEINNTTFSNSLKYGIYLEDYYVPAEGWHITNADPSTVTFSNCASGNIYDEKNKQVYTGLSQIP